MAAIDIPALGAVLKTKYTQKKFNLLAYAKNPFFAMVRKDTNFGGNNKLIGLRNAVPGLVAAAFPTTTSVSASTYTGFTVTRAKAYGLAAITGEAIAAGKGNENSLVDVMSKEIDGAVHAVTRHLAIMTFRNGGGARGQISAASNVGTPTITLANVNDITNFDLNMFVQASVDDGTLGGGVRSAGAVAQITKIDRQAGTLTLGGNWTASIAGVLAGDYLFGAGGVGLALCDYAKVVKGTAGWCPLNAPTAGDSWFGTDRSSDPTRLAGVTYAGNGAPIEETLIEAAWRVVREGGSPDVCFLNPRDYSALVRALGTKVIYDRANAFDEPKIGFKAVMFDGPEGPIKVISDLNQPQGNGSMLQMNTWALESAGGLPRILDEDGQTILRDSTTDSYIVRIGGYGNLTCEAPGFNCTFSL